MIIKMKLNRLFSTYQTNSNDFLRCIKNQNSSAMPQPFRTHLTWASTGEGKGHDSSTANDPCCHAACSLTCTQHYTSEQVLGLLVRAHMTKSPLTTMHLKIGVSL